MRSRLSALCLLLSLLAPARGNAVEEDLFLLASDAVGGTSQLSVEALGLGASQWLHDSEVDIYEDANSGTNNGATPTEVPATSNTLGYGLSVAGGTAYGIAALIVSWGTREKDAGRMGEGMAKKLELASLAILCGGGLCVTFAYMSGASVPLMNAVVYSTNMFLNMLLQIFFKLTPYTKNMRCGTILFGLTALQLGQIAPPPSSVTLDQLFQVSAITWLLVFFVMWFFSLLLVRRSGHLPPTSSAKILAWAVYIACWGSFTDNWAKVQSTFGEPAYTISFVIYLGVGIFVMVQTIWAMAATSVAVYVPTNLCAQLVMNTISAMFIWNEAERVELLLAYLVGYGVCCLSVYIASDELDIGSIMANSSEISSKGLSTGAAKTPFGHALLGVKQQWSDIKQGVDKDMESRRKTIEEALVTGVETKAFNNEELADLALRLWGRLNPSYMPLGTVLAWIKKTPFMEEYLQSDSGFESVLEASLSQDERVSMCQEISAVEMQSPA